MGADLIGLLAGGLTTAAFVPQAWKIWKTRSTKDISLTMYIVFTTGVVLWLTYGLLIGSMPVIAANAVTVILAIFIVIMKLKHG